MPRHPDRHQHEYMQQMQSSRFARDSSVDSSFDSTKECKGFSMVICLGASRVDILSKVLLPFLLQFFPL
jgi:hypothetical protein